MDQVDRRRFPGDLERFWKPQLEWACPSGHMGEAHLAHLGGETDMHHGAEIVKIRARAAASQQETMTPRPRQGCPLRLRRPHRDKSRYRTIQAP